jgi:antitoxin component YwqK of YwqJK toxin-antitoxin module
MIRILKILKILRQDLKKSNEYKMKNHIIISLLFLSVGLSQQEYHSNDLIEMDNGLWTVKFSDEPISGKIYSGFGEDGNIKKVYVGNLLNGKREGRWKIYYHSNGKKEYDYNYKDGERDGLNTEWYENGQKSFEGTFKDGKKDGLNTMWWENGRKGSEITYKNGKRDGLYNLWYDNGQKREKGTYKDGKKDGLSTKWSENGQKIFEINYKDGNLVEIIGMWNEDGSVKE